MRKHTPKPWTKRAVPNVGVKGHTGYAIDFNEDQEQVVDFVYEEADADLICAVHDLLETAESTLKWWEQAQYETTGERGEFNVFDSEPEFVTQARAAIAKVRGEQ